MRTVDFTKRLRRTPWHIYLPLLAVVLWVWIAGFYIGYWAQQKNAEQAPDEDLTVTAEAVPVEPAVLLAAETSEPAPAPAYTDDDLRTLALIIYQEAGGDACSDETRAMVGTVVLNRVASDRYPDTIQEVALQRKQYGRLHWTGLVWPERAQEPGEVHAVERAYRCAEQLLQGARALPADVIYQAEFPQGVETVAQQDGFYFCR